MALPSSDNIFAQIVRLCSCQQKGQSANGTLDSQAGLVLTAPSLKKSPLSTPVCTERSAVMQLRETFPKEQNSKSRPEWSWADDKIRAAALRSQYLEQAKARDEEKMERVLVRERAALRDKLAESQKRASAALEAGRKAKQDQEERQQKRRARHEKMKTLRLSNRKAVYYDDENAES